MEQKTKRKNENSPERDLVLRRIRSHVEEFRKVQKKADKELDCVLSLIAHELGLIINRPRITEIESPTGRKSKCSELRRKIEPIR